MLSIQVEMEITKIIAYGHDMVQVWGHVGDYEVCLHLPKDDPRLDGMPCLKKNGIDLQCYLKGKK